MTKQRVLVAGGAGFIGSHLCDALLAQGHDVTCVDNLCTGSPANLEAARSNPNFRFIEADVAATPIEAYDVVYHLASPASPVWYRQLSLETMHANSTGTEHLLAIASSFGGRFVFASTSEIYGDPLEHPQTENYTGNVNTLGPRACYDESKRFGEAITFEYRRRSGAKAAILRIFNTYGPRMGAADGRVIPAFLDAAARALPLPIQGTGKQTRSFCYVSDTVDALLHVGLDPEADGLVANVGNPNEITILELADAFGAAVGRKFELRFLPGTEDDPTRRCPDISRMRERYGWEPKVDLQDGLRRTLATEAQRSAAATAGGGR